MNTTHFQARKDAMTALAMEQSRTVTCPASRSALMLAESLSNGTPIQHPKKCAAIIFSTVAALWNLRGESKHKSADDGIAQRIQEAVCQHFGVTISQLTSRQRDLRIQNAKHVGMYLCRTMTKLSHKEIAALFNLTDHGTSINSFQVVTKRIMDSPDFAVVVEKIERVVVGSCPPTTK